MLSTLFTIFIGLDFGALFATGVWLWIIHTRFTRPARELAALTAKLAGDQKPPAFYIKGPKWLESITRDLDVLATRLEKLGQERRDEEFNLSVLLENMVEGVMVVDKRHVIQLVNRELVNLFSVQKSPVQRTVLETLRQSGVEMVLREAISSGIPVRKEVILEKGVSDANSSKCFEMSAVPIRASNGEIAGAVAVFHDITRIKLLESVRQEFVANVSHELRTPLSIFRGYLENLIDSPQTDAQQVRRILEAMQRHSNRLNALVEDLLTLTRLDSKELELKLSTIRLEAFIRQLVEDWSQRFSAAPAQIHVEMAPNLPSVELDTVQFGQVLFNLLDNAVAYSNPPRHITVKAQETQERVVEICISDNGIGIPETDLPHIFERFYRVDRGRSRSSGGTGLGLSIVKNIVTMHGGKVEAQSEIGKGTTIKLSLPIEQGLVQNRLK